MEEHPDDYKAIEPVICALALAVRAASRATVRAAHYRIERGRPIRAYGLDDDGALVERIPT